VGQIDIDAVLQRARAVDALATRVQVELAESVPGIRTTSDPTVGYVLQQAWARENVGLIKTVDTDLFDDLATHITAAVTKGQSTSALAALIQARTGAAERHAAFIARDQIAKLNGKVVQQRQQGLGVKRYRWRTVGDERVRDTHRAHDGKIFEWSKPPPGTGHPGHDYNCRCFAEPIFDDEMLDDSPDDTPEMRAAQQEAERRVAERAAARARRQAEEVARIAREAAATSERRAAFMRELEREAQRAQTEALRRAQDEQRALAERLQAEVNAALNAKPGTVRLSNGATIAESPDGKTVTLTLPDGQKRLVSLEPA
jgi:SPP1 gp7 family putative phage head morphogenesis protein